MNIPGEAREDSMMSSTDTLKQDREIIVTHNHDVLSGNLQTISDPSSNETRILSKFKSSRPLINHLFQPFIAPFITPSTRVTTTSLNSRYGPGSVRSSRPILLDDSTWGVAQISYSLHRWTRGIQCRTKDYWLGCVPGDSLRDLSHYRDEPCQ